MPHRDDFPTIFGRLRFILAPSSPSLVVGADAPANSSLDAPPFAAYPRGHFFGTVQVKKHDVGYHLMPVYVFPDLLDGLPHILKRRMQGKSCFNFPSLAALDAETASALARLTAAGYDRYRQADLVAATQPAPP